MSVQTATLALVPRRMTDPRFRADQFAGVHADAHIAPINAFVDAIRDRDGRGWVPYVAPMHGGVDARVLSILRDPGPATQSDVGSGFVAVENDDPTAERQAILFAEVGLDPRSVLPWNAYPWYINAAPNAEQSQAGAEVLVELLRLLPDLRVVLLQGRDAEAGWRRVERLRPGIADELQLSVLSTIHPGRQALFTPDPAERARRVAHQEATFRRVVATLDETLPESPLEPGLESAP
ncbi:uracil-DNA glycosylase [Agromyces sp. MMS24-K17]|uniref:uracil-DNA glycosylase n=1 Tax=Agromyces sp. MMS24-K17 TaxID=3372850 RepID=UPI0037547159